MKWMDFKMKVIKTEVLERLENTLNARKNADPTSSYTAKLFASKALAQRLSRSSQYVSRWAEVMGLALGQKERSILNYLQQTLQHSVHG